MEINGKKVVNGTRKVVLHVTKEDIKGGSTKDPGGCAAARAAVREGHCIAARVHKGRTYLLTEDSNHWVRLQTPPSLNLELTAFDRGGRFVESEHILTPLCKAHRARFGKKQSHSPDGPRKLRKKRPRPYHITKDVRKFGATR